MGSRIGALIIKAETFSPRISTTGDHTEQRTHALLHLYTKFDFTAVNCFNLTL